VALATLRGSSIHLAFTKKVFDIIKFGIKMSKTYFEDKTFEKEDFSTTPLSKGDYENCTFINCIFSNADLSNINFSESEFIGCNMSMASLANAAFRDVKFKDCKQLGLHFANCNPFLFSVNFDGCLLDLSSFYKRSLKKTLFKNCSLHEVDFTAADLSNSRFDNSNLAGAVFESTNLEKSDFRTAYNYTIDPESNRIKKAKFSITGISGLLNKYNIEIEN